MGRRLLTPPHSRTAPSCFSTSCLARQLPPHYPHHNSAALLRAGPTGSTRKKDAPPRVRGPRSPCCPPTPTFPRIAALLAAALLAVGCATSAPTTATSAPPVERPAPEAGATRGEEAASLSRSGTEDAQAMAAAVARQARQVAAQRERARRALRKEPFLMLEDPSVRGRRDLVLVAVGDVAQPARRWPEATQKLGISVFGPTRPLLDSGDLVFMNLENPVSDRTATAQKEYSFTSPPERLGWYLDAGFNLFSLANNHSADAGQEGIDDTIAHLDRLSAERGRTIWYAGAGVDPEQAQAVRWVRPPDKDLTIAFLATGISRHENVSRWWVADLPARIQKARDDGADLVVVSVHAGKEYQHVPHPKIRELYQGWIDAGADLVIGHHPHVIRPVEAYRKGLIIHSLGNYVFMSRTVRHRKEGAKLYGMMTRIVIEDGRLRGAELVPLWVNNSDAWRLDSGQLLPNANFVPQILTGPFADAWFHDLSAWTTEMGAPPPERRGDRGFIRVPQEDPQEPTS